MTTIFSDGFETGNLNKWTGQMGDPTIVITNGHPYYLQVNNNPQYVYKNFASESMANIRVYLKLSSLPSINTYANLIVLTDSTANNLVRIGIWNNAGTICWFMNVGESAQSNFNETIPTSTWICIEAKYDSISGIHTVYRDGSSIINISKTMTAPATALQIGFLSGNMNNTTMNFDRIVLATDYIGPQNNLEVNNLIVYDGLMALGNNVFKDTGLVLNVHWDPGNNGFFEELPPVQGQSYNNGRGPYIDSDVRNYLWVTRISPSDRSSAPNDPTLMTNFAFHVEKDTHTFGFYGTSSDPQKQTGGGAILMGQGLNGVGCPPVFSLTGVQLYQDEATAIQMFPDDNGTTPPTPTGNRAKYYRTDVHALFEDTPIYNENNEKIRQDWKFRGISGPSIGQYPTAYSADPDGYNTGKFWYDSTNKRLMEFTSTIVAPNLQSDKYDTLFLISGESQADQAFALGNLYLNVVQCNKIYNAQNTKIEIHGNLQLNGNIYTSINPDQSVSGTIGLGSPEQQYQGAFIQSPYVNDIYPIPAANGGHGIYIGIQTKLNVFGDFQITGGHVVSSLNPTGSISLGSPTEVWSGINVTTVYMSILSKLNGTNYIQLTDPLYVNGSVGSSGQVLTSRGLGASPQWTTPTSQATIQKGSVTTNASGAANITFPQAFASTPSITCTAVDPSGRHIAVVITSQSATQFSIKTTATGDHKHKVGDIFGTEDFGLGVNSVGDHTHSFSAGAHTHMIGTISATASWTMGIDSQGTHNHTVVGTTGTGGGSHAHTVGPWDTTANDGLSSHTHGITQGSTTTGTTSGHSHSTNYAVSPTQGPNNSYAHQHWIAGSASSNVDITHTHNYSGYSGDSGSHSHNLTNKAPYIRSLMLRDSGGIQHDLGGLLSNTSDSQFDLYTLSSVGGGGTTGSAGGHTHSLSNKPAYTRGLSLRNSSGGSFTIGGVLSNQSVVGTTEAHTETTNVVSNIAITVNWIAVG